MKRIFTFGCSFTSWAWPTWADILIHEYKQRGFEGYNFGRCGAGNQYIFINLIEADRRYKFTENDIVIVEWTTMQREDRFANNRWITPGNIYTQSIYTDDFINKWADPVHYVMRDCALISTVKKVYSLRKVNYIDLSMSAFKYLDSADFSLKFDEVDTVLDFYGEDIKPTLPPMMEYLGLHNREQENRSRRPVTYWDHDKATLGPEWHPTPAEHYDYLSKYILPELKETLSDNTVQFLENWNTRLKNIKQPINLGKTGWDLNYENRTHYKLI